MSEIHSSGTIPLPTDTIRTLEVKILNALNQGEGGSLTGSGSPSGVVTPTQSGILYVDKTTPGLWVSTGTTNTSWHQFD
jgi:hypothetical protein